MTLYYDADENKIIENHPGEWMYIDDEGRFVIDFDACPYPNQKYRSLLKATFNGSQATGNQVTVHDIGMIDSTRFE